MYGTKDRYAEASLVQLWALCCGHWQFEALAHCIRDAQSLGRLEYGEVGSSGLDAVLYSVRRSC